MMPMGAPLKPQGASLTPLAFEAQHAASWTELAALLDLAEAGKKFDGARMAALYRMGCEHYALAQSRAYPIHMVERLERLTQRAHQLIYRRQDFGLARLSRLALVDFPQAVRAHHGYLWAALALFLIPAIAVGWAVWRDPGFILHLVDAKQVASFDSMYSNREGPIGRERSADTDWRMFGYYIMHNIGIGFQCFAGGMFAGLGSAFFLVFNGLFLGAIAAYLIGHGYSENFLSFVVTHSAFELTAIVLAGAAGLRLGHALLAPGRQTRVEALKHAAGAAVVVVYGVIGMLLLAAAIEAFWSSARWVPPPVKYGVGAVCWFLVIAYLGWQGKPRKVTDAR